MTPQQILDWLNNHAFEFLIEDNKAKLYYHTGNGDENVSYGKNIQECVINANNIKNCQIIK